MANIMIWQRKQNKYTVHAVSEISSFVDNSVAQEFVFYCVLEMLPITVTKY